VERASLLKPVFPIMRKTARFSSFSTAILLHFLLETLHLQAWNVGQKKISTKRYQDILTMHKGLTILLFLTRLRFLRPIEGKK
jgi:hypothetical protein